MSDLPLSLHAPHLIPNSLITAEIFYHMPDYPDLLQSFLWQHLDQAPHFPKLRKFLLFWQQSLEGRLHSVRLATTDTIPASTWRQIAVTERLH